MFRQEVFGEVTVSHFLSINPMVRQVTEDGHLKDMACQGFSNDL